MGHHKRGRAKNQRAGCLMCKPHKANGADRRTRPERLAETNQQEQEVEHHQDSLWESQCPP